MTGWIRLLGEVEVNVEGRSVDIGHARQRCVLAVLLAGERQRVSAGQLIERVWDERPPPRARHALHSYLSRLRRILADAGIAAIPRSRDGYSIDVDRSAVDLYRFRDAVTRSHTAPSDEAREALLTEALRQWHGEWAFADLDTPWLAELRQNLARERLAAQAARNDLLLEQGDGARLLPELLAAADAHPLDERITGQLMRALCGCGRPAEALDRYRLIRAALVSELGTEPGPALRTLHQRILSGELDGSEPPDATAGPVPTRSPAVPVPRQLPAPPPRFVGRDAEIAALTAALPPSGERPVTGERPAMVVICGMGGVGKTTLALHWAYEHLADFPDGQLYVNLRGFDPTAPPVEPATVVRGFLDALGVPAQSVPAELAAQTARYRTLVATRRILVLLDNARDADQVRPLLPGWGAGRTLVTSRHDLAGLVATEDARPIPLGLLTPGEAHRLLTARLGGSRTAADPAAVRRIIHSCGRLPLALAVVAGRASVRPTLSLARLADELGGVGRLDELATGDRTADLRAVFTGSYRALRPASARLFRYLGGVHPGPDIDPGSAAALAELDGPATRRALAELVRAHLTDEHVPGRFALHDLLRACAVERVAADREVPAVTRRMLDHYLDLALAAGRRFTPHRDPVGDFPPPPPEPDLASAEPVGALAWFAAEYPVLRALVDVAAAAGLDTHAWQLVWAMTPYFDRSGRWHDWAVTQAAGLAAAVRAGNPAAEADLLRAQGCLYTRLRRFPEAHAPLHRALSLFRRIGDRLGEGRAHLELGWFSDRLGAHDQALWHDARALRLFRTLGHHAAQARALHAVGWDNTQLGRHRAGLRACQRALDLQEELREEDGAAASWDSLGQIHHRLGCPDRAVTCYERALDLRRRLGDRHNEALVLDHLGDAQQAAGRSAAAARAYRAADAIYQALGLSPPARPSGSGGIAHPGPPEPGRRRDHCSRMLSRWCRPELT